MQYSIFLLFLQVTPKFAFLTIYSAPYSDYAIMHLTPTTYYRFILAYAFACVARRKNGATPFYFVREQAVGANGLSHFFISPIAHG